MGQNFFLLGAQDPEMAMMEQILRDRGEHYAYAMNGNVRVHAGNSYRADPIGEVPDCARLVLIECEPANVGDFPGFVRIDHHRPGDPGYDLGPDHFWDAASVGQLHRFLGLTQTKVAMIMAAHDHCFQAAMRGECPGVDRADVLALKVSSIAEGSKVPENVVHDLIDAWASEVAISPTVRIGDQDVRDMRRFDLGVGYSLKLLTAQVGAVVAGHAVLLRHRHGPNDPEACSLRGQATSATARAFMNEWAPAQGLTRIYGTPDREYAGGLVQA